MSEPTPIYSVHGPGTGQDGRAVYTVVRRLPGSGTAPAITLPVAESLSHSTAQAHADALNQSITHRQQAAA